MSRIDREKARRRDRTKAKAQVRAATKARGGHSGREPTDRQVAYAQHLTRLHGLEQYPSCCSLHLSHWISGTRLLAAEGFYSTGRPAR
jgi:hypothetical protein